MVRTTLVFLFFFPILLFSQAPFQIEWEKSLGGSSGDFAYSIDPTEDGGFVVAGNTSSTDGDVTGNRGQTDVWVVKLDDDGQISWKKALGGTSFDGANDVKQTNDGGYIVAGYTASNDEDVFGNHGGRDFWIVKLDAFGNMPPFTPTAAAFKAARVIDSMMYDNMSFTEALDDALGFAGGNPYTNPPVGFGDFGPDGSDVK